MSDQPKDDLDDLLRNGPTRWMYSTQQFSNHNLNTELNNMGRVGWEVVSMTVINSETNRYFENTSFLPITWQVVMKRPWTWILENNK